MALTNLVGTTWKINSRGTTSYQVFAISGTVHITNTSAVITGEYIKFYNNGVEFFSAADGSAIYPHALINDSSYYLYVLNSNDYITYYFNNSDGNNLILTITGGTDSTSTTFISWLQANGTRLPNKVVETSLRFGADALDKSYLGTDSLDRIYLGTDLLYQTLNNYSVTETLSNVATVGTHPVKILEGKSLTLKYTADANYELPDNVTVANATSNWTKSTGTLVVSNPTGDVTITITAVRITYSITENLTNVTKSGTHPSVIAAGQTLVLNYAAATGYNLPDEVTVTGATSDWKPATGALTITNPTGAVTITIVATQPKLATPTNLSVSGDTLTFDAVEHAEQYEVFAGSNSIGTYTVPSKGYTVTISYSSLHPNVCFYSTDNGSTWIDGYITGQSQLVLSNVEQIKFKGQYSSSGDYYAYISVPSLGVSIYATSSSGAKYSDNFVLTQDLSDVTFGSGSD